jgi:hypothetical protein
MNKLIKLLNLIFSSVQYSNPVVPKETLHEGFTVDKHLFQEYTNILQCVKKRL